VASSEVDELGTVVAVVTETVVVVVVVVDVVGPVVGAVVLELGGGHHGGLYGRGIRHGPLGSVGLMVVV